MGGLNTPYDGARDSLGCICVRYSVAVVTTDSRQWAGARLVDSKALPSLLQTANKTEPLSDRASVTRSPGGGKSIASVGSQFHLQG